MARLDVRSIEARADGMVAADVFVLVPVVGGAVGEEAQIEHFTVLLNGVDVANAGATKAARIITYKKLFAADPRIAGILAAERAVAQMKADVTFPVDVTL